VKFLLRNSEIQGFHVVYVMGLERSGWSKCGTNLEQVECNLEQARNVIGGGCSKFVPLLQRRLAGSMRKSSLPIFQV
jgi:hypothetical protein